jgi:hypothetical protein
LSTDTRWRCADLATDTLTRIDQLVGQLFADLRCQPGDEAFRDGHVVVGSDTHTQPELRIVFEQRVRPGRAAAFVVFRPGRCRQVAAVDRRASGGIGHHQSRSEQL